MTREEISDWIAHPVTIKMKKDFLEVKEALVEALENGSYLRDEVGYAQAVGQIAGLNFFINHDVEEDDDEG